jgi:geranylgeranyl diphosphate synthase, type I
MIMEDLQRRSKKGLDFAKLRMKTEKIDNPIMQEALEYYLTNWRDYTHPGLFSLACQAVGGDSEVAVPTQASLAMIAAAFDLHDDIIDRSDTKHAIATVYGKYGEEITILLGNAFMLEGYTLFVRSIFELQPKQSKEILALIRNRLYEVGNAHALELNLRHNDKAKSDDYIHLVNNKAASIDLDMCIGAIVAGGTEEEVKALARYGRILGVLTTLREEFVDVFEIDEISQRVEVECLPIPIIFAMHNCDVKTKVTSLLTQEELSADDIDILIDLIFNSEEVKNLIDHMKVMAAEAIAVTSVIQNEGSKKLLKEWVISMLEDL